MTKENKYACAYIRVSDERQDEYSPDSQLKLIKEYAERNGYEIPQEYIFYDDGISGRSDEKRKAFQDMIGFVKDNHNEIDAIIVWKFSRFMRNQEKSIVYKAMLRKIGVNVISVSETVDESSPFSPLIERIIEFMDEYYSIRLSQEVMRGMTEKVSRGEPVSVAPFGYDLINKQFVPNDDADYVTYCFKAFANGQKLRQIALWLQSKGVLTRRGNPPDYRFVEYMLRNPTYIGNIRWSTNGKGSKSRYKDNDAEIMIVKGHHQPLIDNETWDIVQQKFEEQALRYGKYQRREQPVKFMLKGLLRCDSCGATLVHLSTKEPAVQCHNYNRGACKVSHHLSLSKANEIVLQALKDCCETLSFNITQKSQNEHTVIDFEMLIKKEEDRIERLSQAYLNGIDSLEDYARKKKVIENKISELKASAAEQPEQKFDIKEYSNKVANIIEFIESDASEEAKNEALRTIIDHIDYEKAAQNLHIYFYA